MVYSGCLFFALYASNPFTLVLEWIIIAILVPLLIYVHIWFPVRPVTPQRARRAARGLIGAWVLMNASLTMLVLIWQPSFVTLTISLNRSLHSMMLFGLVGSSLVLYAAYRHTSTEHVRRQIRLIAVACFFVAFCWLFLLIIPTFTDGRTLLPDTWIDLAVAAIPLAYLVGGVAPDLYRLDRVVMRIGAHLVTILLLSGVLSLIGSTLALPSTSTVLWTALCFVVFYRPILKCTLQFLRANSEHTYRPLQVATTRLTTTLDSQAIADTICHGVRATFEQPAHAFYLGHFDGTNELTRVVYERFPNIPLVLAPGTLTDELCRFPQIIENRTIYEALLQAPLNAVEHHMLCHPGIVLWCPIRHTQGYLLGLLLLGMRGDLDPYRAQDIQELRRFLEAATLALTNSAAYMQHREAEATIRQLYQSLQQAQDTTAAAIARGIHDDIINVYIRLNIESLEQLLKQITDPAIQTELKVVLDSERAVGQELRMLCEQLHPSGMDDPLGLSSVLRMVVDETQAHWSGTCQFTVENIPCPIDVQTQREVLRITKEALINAVKHAQATQITVHLRYPVALSDQVQMIIQDNGTSEQSIKAKPGHFGMRNMQESARAIGGSLHVHRVPTGGTMITFMFASKESGVIV